MNIINLDEMFSKEYLEREYKRKSQPLVIDDEEYFLKKVIDSKNAYKELLADELLSVLNIPHVHYYLAKMMDEYYLISKSYFKEDLNIKKGYDLFNSIDSDYMNNLETIKECFINEYGEKFYNSFENQIYDLFCFDILFQNCDRKSDNWTIQEHFYKTNNRVVVDEVSLGLVFDNECIFEDGSYCMGITYDDMKSDNNNFPTIIEGIKKSNKLQNKFIEMINKIDENVFLKCISNVERKLNSLIPLEIKQEFLKQYILRFQQIREICNSLDFKI